MSNAESSSTAYAVRYADAADADIEAAYGWIASRDFAAAERWLAGLRAALLQRAEEHAVLPGRRHVAPDADNFPGRDLRVLRYPTQSGSAAWRVLYELRDEDNDGEPDTLLVAYVRSASRPAPDSPAPTDAD